MTQHGAVEGWDGERGEKWKAHIEPLEAMLAPVDAPLIEALALHHPVQIAEIGCGGGMTSASILRKAPPGSRLRGYDVSQTLINLAADRNASFGPNAAFVCADAQTAQPDAVPFTRLASRFGVMFFENPKTAFRNLAGWLAPEGRFAFAVWGPPFENKWMYSVKEAVAQVTDWPSPDPDGPGPFRYADADRFVDLLTRSGFADVSVSAWNGKLRVGGGMAPADAANFALSAFSIAEVLADLDQAAKDRAHDLLRETFASNVTDGQVAMDARVHIVSGTRAN
ncbi:MAG: class I SAM-dependent methyltransferase [Pseudomonadota bacterium]